MAETEAAVDPRLVALGMASEIVIEFPEGIVEVDMVEAAAVDPAVVLPTPPVVPLEPALPAAEAVAQTPAEIAAEPAPEPVASLPAPAVAAAPAVPAPIPAPAEPVLLRVVPPPPADLLPDGPGILEAPIVRGRVWPRPADLRVEELGMRIPGAVPVGVRWTDVVAIDVRGDRIEVRTKTGTITFAAAMDGVAAPEVNDAFARVLREAHEGQVDLQGSAVHELQNAGDAVRDTFHSSDDAFIPLALGGALSVLTAIIALALPEILSFLTRPSVPPNAFVLGSRLAPFDPRVLLVALAGAAVATALTARAALGPHARSWARGTLRGWHSEPPSVVRQLRRGLALVFLYPSLAAAVLVAALVVALPSARSHATVDPRGVHVVRPIPVFDRTASWSEVEEIVVLAASGPDHPHGLAVLLRFTDRGTVTTADLPVRNSTDRYLLELTRKWRDQAVSAGR